jgi:hypothetical protein
VAHLEGIENDFQSFLLTGSAAEIEKRVVGTQRVPIATRLAIYGDGYRSRLIETLQSHYPALLALLGEESFEALGETYVQAHDSSFASIRFYGGELDALLAALPEYASKPWLAELARFEWAMNAVFDAADAPCIEVQALGRVPPENWAGLGFDLHPAVRRLDLVWNAPALWRALTDGHAHPEPAGQEHPIPWLLWRKDLQIFYRQLTALEAEALDAVHQGQSFGGVCVALCAALDEEQAPGRAAAFLREWVESGMIVGMHACKE